MEEKIIKINNTLIGGSNPVFIIAEIAQAHDGSLGNAHAYIDAAARAGVDAVKFQTHIAKAESSKYETWRVKFSYQDNTRYDYWQRMEFTIEQWFSLKKHAEEKKLIFLSSPFSLEAVELLKKINIKAWKIASGELNNKIMLDEILKTKLPVLLSTGMSNFKEIDNIVDNLNKFDVDYAILQCTSIYPCPPEKVGLNLIQFLKNKYFCPVGLSDHTGKIYSSLAAVALGADIIEVHITFSRDCFGPDVPASITVDELKMLVEGSKFIKKCLLNPVNKDSSYQETLDIKKLFNKSIFYSKSLRKGEVLRINHLKFLKPGLGISPDRVGDFLGKPLARDVSEGKMLEEEDFYFNS